MENAAKYVTEHLVKTETYCWRLAGKTRSQGNGCGTSRVTEGVRVNVKFTHGPFSETFPTFYSNLQFGSTLPFVATRQSHCQGVVAEFLVAAWPEEWNHPIASIYLHWIPNPFQWGTLAMGLHIPLAITPHLL